MLALVGVGALLKGDLDGALGSNVGIRSGLWSCLAGADLLSCWLGPGTADASCRLASVSLAQGFRTGSVFNHTLQGSAGVRQTWELGDHLRDQINLS